MGKTLGRDIQVLLKILSYIEKLKINTAVLKVDNEEGNIEL